MSNNRCLLGLVLLLVGYAAYVVSLFAPRIGEYVVRASLAVLVGFVAYMIARYILAKCRRVEGAGSDELLRTPVG